MEPLSALAAFAPLLIDLGKAAIGKFIGANYKPANMAEYLQMQRADVERFSAINNAGGANPSYPWVEAIVRLQRPFVAAAVLGTWAYAHTTGTLTDTTTIDNAASIVSFYLFGDRTLTYIRGKA